MPKRASSVHIQRELERLSPLAATPEAYWPELLERLCHLFSASSGLITLYPAAGEDSAPQHLCLWPDAEETRQRFARLLQDIGSLLDQAEEAKGIAQTRTDGIGVLALKLHCQEEQWRCFVLLLRYDNQPFDPPAEAGLRLLSDAPLIAGAALPLTTPPQPGPAPRDNPLQQTLELVIGLDSQPRFLQAAMYLCNQLAAGFQASRVSLGWQKGRYLRLVATSHAQKLDKKMDSVRLLESAMEEALDQDDEVVYPDHPGHYSINREHAGYVRQRGIACIASIPLRIDNAAVAVITLERLDEPFQEREIETLRLIADTLSHRLHELKRNDRWFGARLADAIRGAAALVLGVEHTWAKLLALGLSALMAFLIFYPWPYRIEAAFTLKPRQLTNIPAPFDSYIREVNARVGDQVAQGQPLLRLDSKELQLQGNELSAAIKRYISEARRAKADGKSSSVHIALARAEESRAQLKKVQYNLSLATIKAPFGGIVVEGDLQERINAPVARGELLFKLTRLEDLYAEIRISEQDIQEVRKGSKGELAFASRPEQHFAIQVQAIEPMARSSQEGNQFIVRGELNDAAQEWWRPGMTGVAKLDVDKRSLLWIFSHRLIDFLRLRLWF